MKKNCFLSLKFKKICKFWVETAKSFGTCDLEFVSESNVISFSHTLNGLWKKQHS